MTESVIIGDRAVGEGCPVFIVAELSANHLQKFDIAVKLVKEAKKAGADAVKLQTYTPETITIDCDSDYFKIKQGTIWDGISLAELYRKAYTPWEWQPELMKIARSEGLICFSSPFDRSAVDFLEKMDVPAYKVASFEITDIPLIEYIASRGKPVIISTGIATVGDIEEAVNACKRMDNSRIILMKCTSTYPAPVDEVNLRTIPNMAETFDAAVGLSDHTQGTAVPIGAVALGAVMIEKHFTLDRSMGGPDAAFSIQPDEFRYMTDSVREMEKALGRVSYRLSDSVEKSRECSRSLFIVRDIREGELLDEENVRSIRPGFGLHPKYMKNVIGKRAAADIKKGTPLDWTMLR